MVSRGLSLCFAGLLLAVCIPSATQAQIEVLSQGLDQPAEQSATLELIKAPPNPYPEEALRKQIEGMVTLRIVVDSHGKVSEAKALSGPTELLQGEDSPSLEIQADKRRSRCRSTRFASNF